MSAMRKPTSTLGLESAHGMALIQWADTMARTSFPALNYLHHIANGGARSKATAGRLKAEGVRRGVWDYFLPVQQGLKFQASGHCTLYPGIYIELKHPRERGTKDGGLSDEQQKFGLHVHRNGYATVVAYDWTEAQQALLAYLAGNEVPFLWVPKVQHA